MYFLFLDFRVGHRFLTGLKFQVAVTDFLKIYYIILMFVMFKLVVVTVEVMKILRS